MALPEHVREKLRLHALKNKGRTNLTGLDRSAGLAGIDYVMEHCEEAIKRWGFRADGTLRYDTAKGESFDRYLNANCRTHYDEGQAVPNRYFVHCPWVRLGYTADWIKDELALRWPHRFISFMVRDEIKHDRVFPVGVACEFLRFLWPTREEFNPRAEKYVNRYSEGYIQRHPGIGARIRMKESQWRAGDLCTVTGINTYIIQVTFDAPHPDPINGGLTAGLDRESAKLWEVVG